MDTARRPVAAAAAPFLAAAACMLAAAWRLSAGLPAALRTARTATQLARKRLHVMGKRGETEEERRARKEAVKVGADASRRQEWATLRAAEGCRMGSTYL